MEPISFAMVRRLEDIGFMACSDRQCFHWSAARFAKILMPRHPDPHFVFAHVNWDVMEESMISFASEWLVQSRGQHG